MSHVGMFPFVIGQSTLMSIDAAAKRLAPVGRRAFAELLADRRGLLDEPRYAEQVQAIVRVLVNAFRDGRKVYWFGNGGSAADAQHLAAEFSGRFLRERKALASEAMSTNTSAVTAIANDYGYDQVFARLVEAMAVPGDVVIGMTTSGNSPNIVNGLRAAKRLGATPVSFTGNGGGAVSEIAQICLVGPDGYSALVQEVHITMGHIVCDLVEQEIIAA
jgi:D-sedoheptulose 7-phosphate isomerase